jgi:hypothetical protein
LEPPTIAGGVDAGDLCALEKGHVVVNHFQESEHIITLDDLEHPVYGWDFNVVNQKHPPRFDLRVEIEILKVWERISMWTIKQGELKFLLEPVRGQGFLRGSFNESHVLRLEQWAIPYLTNAVANIFREDQMVGGEM